MTTLPIETIRKVFNMRTRTGELRIPKDMVWHDGKPVRWMHFKRKDTVEFYSDGKPPYIGVFANEVEVEGLDEAVLNLLMSKNPDINFEVATDGITTLYAIDGPGLHILKDNPKETLQEALLYIGFSRVQSA